MEILVETGLEMVVLSHKDLPKATDILTVSSSVTLEYYSVAGGGWPARET